MKQAVAMLAALALSGCAIAANGFDQRIAFDTKPAGATVAVDSVGSCTTPCSMVMGRGGGHIYVAKVTKDGCYPIETAIKPQVDSALYYAWLPDFVAGSAYDLKSDRTSLTLLCP